MARDVHLIPVSVVSFEYAFSSSGRIIDDRWQSLKSEMVEAPTVQETFVNIDFVDNFDINFQTITIVKLLIKIKLILDISIFF